VKDWGLNFVPGLLLEMVTGSIKILDYFLSYNPVTHAFISLFCHLAVSSFETVIIVSNLHFYSDLLRQFSFALEH